MLDVFLFTAFPYVSVVLAVSAGIYRYKTNRYTYSSLSSQFLEGRKLFWGSVPWHFGIVVILLAHLIPLVAPGLWARLIGHPTRLYALEVTGLSLALLAGVGMVVLIVRRISTGTVRRVTSAMDAVVLLLLLIQVAMGFSVALFYRWGSDWYLHTAVPWLWSLATFRPNAAYVTALPLLVRLHMLGGFVLLAIAPFTRLVHIASFPLSYLWRPYQVVVWYRARRPAPQGAGEATSTLRSKAEAAESEAAASG